MSTHHLMRTTFAVLALSATAFAALANAQSSIQLAKIGDYSHGGFDVGASEIVAHDPESQRLFVVNAQAATVDILDISDPTDPTLIGTIDVSSHGAVANSVDVHDGVVAVAIEAAVKQDPGVVAFYTTGGTFITSVTVGALPDMVTFTPDGKYVLTANEGEPNGAYTVDPLGSVSIVEIKQGVDDVLQSDVRTVDFSSYNNVTLDASVRVFGPNATTAQDFEPEYVAVSENSKTAYVTLQENNAIAVIDIKKAQIERVMGLGFKDHSLAQNALDASDRDNVINIATWPVHGMYLPDAIAAFKHNGKTYLVTANEGDARDYDGFGEERRVRDVVLDPVAFPDRATLRDNTRMGRLRMTSTLGDADGDGDYDAVYSFGARSFTIRDDNGSIVYDSGDDLETITALAYPANFNASSTDNGFDGRSDDKGPEPEGVAVGEAYGTRYAFIGLERIGGIVVYDIDDPAAPVFVQYINSRDFTGQPSLGTAGDLGPEGLRFIAEEDSPIDSPLLVVGNEISGTTAIYEIEETSDDELLKLARPDDAQVTRIAYVGPNPSTTTASIAYSVGAGANVSLAIVDAVGREVAVIARDNAMAGAHLASIDLGALAPGGYYVTLRSGNVVVDVRPLNVVR